MLSHLSHLLQPLNVACFAPLKRSSSDGILALARNHIYHISKETFLLAFKAAYDLMFTKENARAGFRGARLVPFNPDAVLLIRQRMQRRPGSSTGSLNEQVRQLSKGAQQIAHNIVLLQEKLARMRSAIKKLTKRKGRKRRYVRVEETLTVSEVLDLIAKREGSSRKDGETPAKRVALRGAAAVAARLGTIPAPVR